MFSIKATREKLIHKTIDYIKKVQNADNSIFFICPFCEKQIKYEASIGKDGSFICQSCSKKGDIFILFKAMEADLSEVEIISILAERLNIYI